MFLLLTVAMDILHMHRQKIILGNCKSMYLFAVSLLLSDLFYPL